MTRTLREGAIYKMTSFSSARSVKTILFASLLLTLSVFVFGTKHAAAISDNFPEGHSVYNEWILLSQYKCPGHCLDTPKAEVRIFYKISALDADSVAGGDFLQVTVQTLCRFVGTPNGNASLDGGTNRPGWPNLNCTGLNTSSGGSELSTFSIRRNNLNCGQSGATGKYPGWCFTDLHLTVADDANHPLLGVWINTADGLGNVKITAQEEGSPSTGYPNSSCYTGAGGSCSPSGGPPRSDNLFALWNNYANNGPETHHRWSLTFAPDCTITNNQRTFLRWYDADDGGSGNNGTQSGQISFDLHDDTAGNYIFNNRTDLGGNDSFKDISFTMRPNHTYTWTWNNVSATNGIQLWIPASEIGSRINCPQPGNPPAPPPTPAAGFAACNVVSPASGYSPFIGQTVNIVVQFENHSNDTDWHTSPYTNGIRTNGETNDKQHSGVLLQTGEDEPLASRIEGGTLVPGDKLVSINHPGQIPPYDWKTTRTFTVTNSNPGVRNATYDFGIRNDVTGNFFGSSNGNSLCSVSFVWQPISLVHNPCKETSVNNPGNLQFYLVFYDAAGGVVYNSGSAVGPYSGSPTWNDTFGSFPNLYPHNTYTIVAYQWGSDAELDRDDIPICMSASCQNSVGGAGVASKAEPGEPTSLTYGLTLKNYSNHSFPAGTYYAQVYANPGLFMTPPNPNPGISSPVAFAPNGVPVNYEGPWAVTAQYTGSFTAHLLFGATNIDGLISDPSLCSPPYTPETRPTLKVTNGDISTGGAFKVFSTCPGKTDTPANKFTNGKARYVAPGSPGSTDNSGGLRTFANPVVKKGSGADFAAYALGFIHGSSGGAYGFYSAGKSTDPLNYAGLMFANNTGNGATSLGGLLGGEFTDAHCATDYFNNTRTKVLSPQNRGQVELSGLGTDQYFFTAPGGLPCLRIRGSLPAGARATIYTTDDVCINGPTAYDAWQFDTANQANNAPYLTVITLGSIYVDSGVHNMTGLYIAQPKDDGSAGAFYTCANDNNAPSPAFVSANCQGQLHINGAVIAQHVFPVRAYDTLYQYSGSNSSSEVFNYIPSMVIGQPNLAPSSGGAAVPNSLDSLNNLPPVF